MQWITGNNQKDQSTECCTTVLSNTLARLLARGNKVGIARFRAGMCWQMITMDDLGNCTEWLVVRAMLNVVSAESCLGEYNWTFQAVVNLVKLTSHPIVLS